MKVKADLGQMAKDGLLGVFVTLLIFILAALAVVAITFIAGKSNAAPDFLELMSTFPETSLLVLPILFVGLISFLGNAVGGRLIENVSSRSEWRKSILKSFLITWILGLALSTPILFTGMMGGTAGRVSLTEIFGGVLIGLLFTIQIIIPFSGCCSGIGALAIGLIGAQIQPEKRLNKMLLLSVVSSAVGYAVGAAALVFPLAFA